MKTHHHKLPLLLTIALLFTSLLSSTATPSTKIFSENFNHYSNYHKEKLEGYLIFHKNPAQELILLSGFLKMESTLLARTRKYKNNKPLLDQWGDLEIDSYSKVIQVVRSWIYRHQEDYTLNKQTY